MSKTVEQIYISNPTTVVADTDLYYLVQSPYTPGADAAISGASLKAVFGTGGTINAGLINQLGYYAAAGTTISGLATLASGVLVTDAGSAPAISQTLPSAVQGNITALGTIATGVWNGTLIGGTYGGTGVNNGARTITIGGNFSMVGGFTFAGTVTGNTAVTFPTSGTLATTSQLLISPLTTKGDLWGWSTTNDRLPVGATNGQVLQVSSGATLGLAYSTTTYPSTALNAARILRSDGTNYVDTTSTFADTYAASGFLYANGGNNVAGLATANNGLPVTNNTGVPSILAGPGTTGNMLISNAAAAPSFTTFTYPTTVGATGSIHISNGTNIISSTSLWPNTVGTSGKIVISDGTSNVYSTPTYPNASVTSGKVIISDGTNYIASTSIFPNTVGTAGKLIRSDGTVNAYTTSTYPDTNAVSTLLYASSANVMAALATANNGVLVTDSGGVPSISSTLPAAVITNIVGRLLNTQVFTSGSSTYTPTAGTTKFIAFVQGAGGGGAGGGTTPTDGGAGANTTLSNGGGTLAQGVGGAPGKASSGSPTLAGTANTGTVNLTGSAGVIGATTTFGGNGGAGIFGTGAGVGGLTAAAPSAGGTNTGAGGGGGGGTASAGGGGQAGGLSILYNGSVTGTYTAAIGAAGTAGTSAGNPGAAGGSGIIIIFEFS